MPIRVVMGIKHHFPTRMPEWLMTYLLVATGINFMLPSQMFAMPSYSTMAEMMPETVWGAALVAMGSLRLIALIINGTLWEIDSLRQSSSLWAKMLVGYSKFSPHVRSAMAFFACFFWFTWLLGFATAGSAGNGIIFMTGFLLADLWNASRAAVDADRVNRNVPT